MVVEPASQTPDTGPLLLRAHLLEPASMEMVDDEPTRRRNLLADRAHTPLLIENAAPVLLGKSVLPEGGLGRWADSRSFHVLTYPCTSTGGNSVGVSPCAKTRNRGGGGRRASAKATSRGSEEPCAGGCEENDTRTSQECFPARRSRGFPLCKDSDY